MLRNGTFQTNWIQQINKVLFASGLKGNREFYSTFKDQSGEKHFFPSFLSKMSPPDALRIEHFKATANKIRTVAEVAHFVRCIPYLKVEKSDFLLSPNFLLSLGMGDKQDHALLMACMFMGCQFTTTEELSEYLKQEGAGGEGKISKKIRAKLKKKAQQARKKVRGKLGKLKGKTEDLEEDIKDIFLPNRVFVCIGTLKNEQPHMWTMLISKDYEQITFWDPTISKSFTMIGRIKYSQKHELKKFLESKPIQETISKKKTRVEDSVKEKPAETMNTLICIYIYIYI